MIRGLPLFFLAAAFALAARLEPEFAARAAAGGRDEGVLASLLGGTRKLFGRHLMVKADMYFHGGYYPSIFDQPPAQDTHDHEHGADEHEGEHSPACAHQLGEARDWLDAFGRNFYPSRHLHVGAANGGAVADADREVLPWYQLAIDMDPSLIESYLVASYWLRTKMRRPEQAELVLMQGLRANPEHPQLLAELGHLAEADLHDPARARRVLERALASWNRHPPDARLSDEERADAGAVLYEIAGSLAHLDEVEGRPADALRRLEETEARYPMGRFTHWIARLKAPPGSLAPAPRP